MLTRAEFLASPNPKVVIFHKNCLDGFAAAFTAWKVLGKDATYLPHNYGDTISGLPPGRCTILMVDVSFARDLMEAVAANHDLVVLDHHKTAQANLEGLDFAHFDMAKSGAMLAWDYFHPGKEAPAEVQYVMDRDLWKFTLPQCKEITAALSSYPYDVEAWDKIDGASLATEGVGILRYLNQQVESLLQHAQAITIDGIEAVYLNSPIFQSEIGHRLLEKFTTAKFALVAFQNAEGINVFSLRSRRNPDGSPEFDVSQLAKKFGGGGHPNAAGFRGESNNGFTPTGPAKS